MCHLCIRKREKKQKEYRKPLGELQMHLQFVWFVKESGRSLSKKKKVEGKMGKERKIVETEMIFLLFGSVQTIFIPDSCQVHHKNKNFLQLLS